jgi:hypothetical protein
MKYAVEMDSSAMKYKPSFIEIRPAIQKLMRRGGGFADRMEIE